MDLVGWDYSSADPDHYQALVQKHTPLLRHRRRFVLSLGATTTPHAALGTLQSQFARVVLWPRDPALFSGQAILNC